ncbi:hypothetical protein ALC62_11437 [Cyphomyrmex costatus]|uniref:Uncharacterized protein n=1 Tax=Cyphomyrmex costatus TaxID=456900 RepID=A0A195CCZ7_9HYME|nr:hypothetical protein ALC62_11437 [Cyphomyrmex costatus]
MKRKLKYTSSDKQNENLEPKKRERKKTENATSKKDRKLRKETRGRRTKRRRRKKQRSESAAPDVPPASPEVPRDSTFGSTHVITPVSCYTPFEQQQQQRFDRETTR